MWKSGTQLVNTVTNLHRDTVVRWHLEPLDNPYDELLETICQQHQFNYLLWHEEDIARSPNVGDQRIAEVKRQIDKYNQQRNDWIERIDEAILAQLQQAGVIPDETVPLNTETPGSAMDRLSIMALRIFHMHEQLQREDADDEHKQSVTGKLVRCHEQQDDLSTTLAQLLDDLASGTKRLKLYRQMKMYNDPSLNPYLYQGKGTGT